MAVKLADAVAFLSTDDSKLKSGLASAEGEIEKSGNGFSSVLSGVGMSIGMGVAGIAADALVKVTSFMGDSTAAASDLAETTSKITVLFGESSDEIMAWAENSERAMGLTETAALDAVGGIGNMFMQLGAGAEDAAAVGESMVQLSADIASFHNVSGGATEVLDTMSAAFRGEYDALQRYIPTINAAAVEQEALAATGKESAKELTALEKAAAVQAIVMRDAGAAVGDFARTAGGAANQQRILDAQMAELSTTIGNVLLPAQTAITTAMNDMLTTVLPPLADFMQTKVAPAFTMIADAINKYVMPAVTAIISWFGSLGVSMDAQTNGPMSYMAAWFAENMPRIQKIVETVLSAITAFWDEHGATIMAAVEGIFGFVVGNVTMSMQTIGDLIQLVLQVMTGDWDKAGETLRGIFERWRDWILNIFGAITTGITTAWNSIDWGGLGRSILEGIAAGITGAVSLAVGAMQNAGRAILDSIKGFFGIRSPSQVMADEVGGPLVDGLLQGFQQALGVAGQINGALFGGLGSFLGISGGGGTTVTVNVYTSSSDPAAVGAGAAEGVLAALRSAGIR